MVERLTVDQVVEGSTPFWHPLETGPATRLAPLFFGANSHSPQSE